MSATNPPCPLGRYCHTYLTCDWKETGLRIGSAAVSNCYVAMKRVAVHGEEHFEPTQTPQPLPRSRYCSAESERRGARSRR
ncbi:hypothetical protein GW17_00042322 [Ensete ventricosum]|nr:hypothetical protein GW17_00042322 [Ensete ventricosum]